ncbi:acyl-CoA dehydrogenase family protein [Comamonas testosteroni]|uniref:Acyl-CoA dehydrogenase domain protein n=2 Tax=Comamonas testosteroni TaxID=285 RepID=B7X4U3_COMTK|nr:MULTISPECIES: acyl-CoA dehydrogenase family protein [Comamonas]EED68721.1 acyl-CoA dehydrogenase domain protein [Comamonas testosteroni KF-1]MPS87331.1 acyl-CoA dehydrogenase [Comamonas sp.]TYK73271.1 acyl-CoA dehydrogenase [Comamonas sp. Z3]WQG66724.1 acyl-CoA dehydrogenase family protein [Comamonas testosteroni]
MDFQLSEDQRAFADMAQSLFADYCTDDKLREHDASGQPFMQELWQQCVAAGLHSILVPEAAGGLGLGMSEMLAVLEQQGRALAQVPLWQQQVAAAAVVRFAEGQDAVVQSAMQGELLALSLQAAVATRGPALQLQGDRLKGQLQAVPLGEQAQMALVAAAAGDEIRLVLVSLQADGVSRVAGMREDYCAVADISFRNTPVLAVLGGRALDWVHEAAIACLASLQQGVTQEQLRRTVEYVSERKQFDRPIGSFQLVQGQMADGYILMQAQRSALSQLVWRLDAGLPCVPQAHAVRAQSNELGLKVGRVAQHVHGGMGVDVTYHIHRFMFWCRALAAELGSAEQHLEALGQWLADNDTLGWKYDLPEDR